MHLLRSLIAKDIYDAYFCNVFCDVQEDSVYNICSDDLTWIYLPEKVDEPSGK